MELTWKREEKGELAVNWFENVSIRSIEIVVIDLLMLTVGIPFEIEHFECR